MSDLLSTTKYEPRLWCWCTCGESSDQVNGGESIHRKCHLISHFNPTTGPWCDLLSTCFVCSLSTNDPACRRKFVLNVGERTLGLWKRTFEMCLRLCCQERINDTYFQVESFLHYVYVLLYNIKHAFSWIHVYWNVIKWWCLLLTKSIRGMKLKC